MNSPSHSPTSQVDLLADLQAMCTTKEFSVALSRIKARLLNDLDNLNKGLEEGQNDIAHWAVHSIKGVVMQCGLTESVKTLQHLEDNLKSKALARELKQSQTDALLCINHFIQRLEKLESSK